MGIALRGIDNSFRSLDIEEYLGSGVREKSSTILTRRIGPRTYSDILERREKELFAERLTDIDRALLWQANADGLVQVRSLIGADWKQAKSREQKIARLSYLSERGLAERVSGDSWRLETELRETLKRLALREQLIQEKVPGWRFLETLEKSGVIRKTLALGESLTGRIIGTNIADPFGEARLLLLEGTDGATYLINQPNSLNGTLFKAESIATLTRRQVTKLGAEQELEFTYVVFHEDWRRSAVLDAESVAILEGKKEIDENPKRLGFPAMWGQAVKQRAEELLQLGLNPQSQTWKGDLETLRFQEADPNAREWSPREHVNTDLFSDEALGAKALESRSVVGKVICISEEKFLVRDVRDNRCRIVALRDVGLLWPPNEGDYVSLVAKTLPHAEVRPIDRRIAELLVGDGQIAVTDLSQKESRFGNRSLSWQVGHHWCRSQQ